MARHPINMKPFFILCAIVAFTHASLAQIPAPPADDRPATPPAGDAPRPFGPPGMMAERKIVKQFDQDGDKRLDKAERTEARDFLKKNPAPQRGLGGPGGRGGFPGGPGGFRPPGMGGAPGGYRPSPGGAPYRAGPPAYGAAPPSFNDFVPMDDRGRPFKNKGSRRNIRRRKRGFD